MDNNKNSSEPVTAPTATQSQAQDITQEEYKGTGKTMSAFGYGAVEGKLGTLAGAAVGIVAGTAIGKPVIKFEKAAKDGLVSAIRELGNNSGVIKIITTPIRGVLKALTMLMDFAAAAPKHLLESMPTKWRNSINNSMGERFESGMIGGEIGAVVGFIATSSHGAAQGIAAANAGEDQHKRAVTEIKALRAENAKFRNSGWAEQTAKSREADKAPGINTGPGA